MIALQTIEDKFKDKEALMPATFRRATCPTASGAGVVPGRNAGYTRERRTGA
jgi:hypothetical protein